MKVSIRTEKLTSENYKFRHEHSDRTTNAKSFDSEKSSNNEHFKSKHFKKSIPDFWEYVREDFDNKKQNGLIQKNKRFLKKTSTKNTQDKNGNKKSSQVETSIIREFVIQLGNEKDGYFDIETSKEYYKNIMQYITERYKLTILEYDFHGDETAPHLHFFTTQYNFNTGEFSKTFNKKEAYSELQNEIFDYVNYTMGIEIEQHQKKITKGKDYITPAEYKKQIQNLKKENDVKNIKVEEFFQEDIDNLKSYFGYDSKKIEELVMTANERILTLREENKKLKSEIDTKKQLLLKQDEELENYKNAKQLLDEKDIELQKYKIRESNLIAENERLKSSKSNADILLENANKELETKNERLESSKSVVDELLEKANKEVAQLQKENKSLKDLLTPTKKVNFSDMEM